VIGVDTNVLVRLFVDDGSPERQRALGFFAGRGAAEPIFVTIVTLVEFVWLLSSRYEYARSQALDAVEELTRNAGFLLEHESVVVELLQRCRASGSGLTDELVVALAVGAGCQSTVTFDRDAAKRIPGMELLK
jgi:predicted nucleic-acid-binding protein